jgi:hypothetical protein
MLPHPPYSPDLAPADFFLFRKVKEQLAGLHRDPGEPQERVGGGNAHHRRRRFRHRLLAVVRAQ